jgi:deazaflavin-dependent oxidoreductase (nitroreductase family)
MVLVASLAGAPHHPVWYHNLVKHPHFEVTVGQVTRRLVARVASQEEKAQVWPLCCTVYPDFQLYQDRTARDIPVFICAPAHG